MKKLEELEGECRLEITDALNSFGRKCYEVGYHKAMAQLADMTEECKSLGRKEVVEVVSPIIECLSDTVRRKWQA